MTDDDDDLLDELSGYEALGELVDIRELVADLQTWDVLDARPLSDEALEALRYFDPEAVRVPFFPADEGEGDA